MYKVVFFKSIWDGETPETARNFAVFRREETLPFAPSVGVEFFWGRGFPNSPKSVRWEFDESLFVCTMPDEFPHEIELDEYDYRWLIENAALDGWTLVSNKAI
jgi:hypothetical protein